MTGSLDAASYLLATNATNTAATALRDGLSASVLSYDAVIYGGTARAVFAAAHVARMGFRPLIIAPNGRIGGIDTGGLARRDMKGFNPHLGLNLLSRRQRAREAVYYGVDLATFAYSGSVPLSVEPKVAENLYREMLKEYGIPVLYFYRVSTINKPNLDIESIIVENIYANSQTKKIVGQIFIECSDECNFLIRTPGVTYNVGREANATYSETLSGVRGLQTDAGITTEVSPYVTAGVAASGLLPYVNAATVSAVGTADGNVQAFNHRLITTTDVANMQASWPQPLNYNPQWYEIYGRLCAANPTNFVTLSKAFLSVRVCTQTGINPTFSKYDWNNNGLSWSSDFIGGNVGFFTTDYAAQQTIVENHFDYTLGFVKFLQTDSRVPSALKTLIAGYALTKDEFQSDAYASVGQTYAARLKGTGMSPELYVREGARVVGDYVMTQAHVQKTTTVTDPVAYGIYNIDSHFCSRWATSTADSAVVRAEGGMTSILAGTFGIDYRVMLPKARECGNLLIVGPGMSTTHTAYNATRLEMTFNSLGEAAGVAAGLSLRTKRRLHAIKGGDLIPYLRTENTAPANVINVSGASAVASPANATITVTGTWTWGNTATADFLGVGYASVSGGSGQKIRVTPNSGAFPAGPVQLQLNMIVNSSSSLAVKVIVNDSTGTYTLYPKVQKGKTFFADLGVFQWAGDGTDYIEVWNAGDPNIAGSGSAAQQFDAVSILPL